MSFAIVFHNQEGGWVASDGLMRDYASGAALSAERKKYFRTAGGAIVACCGFDAVCRDLEERFRDSTGGFEELLPKLEEFAHRIYATRTALPGARPLGIILAARDRAGRWRSCKIVDHRAQFSNDGWTGPWLGAEDQLHSVLPAWGEKLVAAPEDARPELMRQMVAAAAAACPTKIGGTVYVEPLAHPSPGAVTQVDSAGNIIVLGTAGTGPQWQLGNGAINISTGGSQVKRIALTRDISGANGGATYGNGQTVYFHQADGTPYLLDANGAVLPPFENPPYVMLQPYGVATPPQVFYAESVTNKSFVVAAYNGGTAYDSGSLTNGTGVDYVTGAGATALSVTVRAFVQTVSDMPSGHPRFTNQKFTVNYSVTPGTGGTGGGSGSFQVTWSSDGGQYNNSVNVPVNIPSGDHVTITASWDGTLPLDVSAVTASYTVAHTSATPVTSGLNFTALIAESW